MPSKPAKYTLTLEFEPKFEFLLKAAAAYDNLTPEQYAAQATHGCMVCSLEAMNTDLR